ncbi:MAG TPA: SH3 domain-containing protein [Anaerolineales bacterium]|nr:SH3 domain-containing protein [Anaerolineales bacterium]
MDTSTRAPRYDLFKLVVAILLLLLFICLLLWIPANAPLPSTPTSTPFLLTETPTADETSTSAPPTDLPPPSPSSTSGAATSTPPADPSATQTATVSASRTATPTPFSEPTSTFTAEPSPTQIVTLTSTGTPASELTATEATETEEPPSGAYTCESALSRSRLQVGGDATILRRLNFRSSPGIQNNWLRTNLSGTKVEVLDGPVCLPFSRGAYVWWQIRLPDGQVGWSAEISLLGRFYFMEPN